MQNGRPAIARILLGGIIAGTLDIGAACLISGHSVPYVLHSIAGGLLAEASFRGGATTAVLGALLQEFMAIIIAGIYLGASRYLAVITQRWISGGLGYGVIIFSVMNYIVVPLSAWRRLPHFSVRTLLENLVAMLLFGVIVAFSARRISVSPKLVSRRAP